MKRSRACSPAARNPHDLVDELALMEGFALPEPDLEPITHFDMRF